MLNYWKFSEKLTFFLFPPLPFLIEAVLAGVLGVLTYVGGETMLSACNTTKWGTKG